MEPESQDPPMCWKQVHMCHVSWGPWAWPLPCTAVSLLPAQPLARRAQPQQRQPSVWVSSCPQAASTCTQVTLGHQVSEHSLASGCACCSNLSGAPGAWHLIAQSEPPSTPFSLITHYEKPTGFGQDNHLCLWFLYRRTGEAAACR